MPTAWFLDQQDKDSIGGPLARIIARRVPVGEGEAGDVVDAITLIIGTGGYLVKSIAVERRERAELGNVPGAGWNQQYEQDQGVQP